MVRIRSRPAKLLNAVLPPPKPLRKRKSKETDGNDVRKGNLPGTNAKNLPTRASKRTRLTHLPYQSPASLDAIIGSTRKSTKIDETPKRKVQSVRAPPRPSKPVKRLQQKTKNIIEKANQGKTQPSVRRKLLGSPQPVKPKRKKNVPEKGKSKILKKVGKAVKVTKKSASSKTISSKQVAVRTTAVTPKKRKATSVKQEVEEQTAFSASSSLKDGKRSKKVVLKAKKGKLQPRPELTCYEKDPTFETKLELPFISTLSHSRLVLRAVILNDMKLLKKLTNDEPEKIDTVCMNRSVSNTETAMHYILKSENREAFKLLRQITPKKLEKFGSCPTVMISEEGTGSGSYMMFGHGLRQVSVGRGGKEGNNAFLYDRSSCYNNAALFNFEHDPNSVISKALDMEVSSGFMDFLMEQLKVQVWDYYSILHPLRRGQFELVGKCIAKANQRGGYGFNFLHEEALTKKAAASLTPFKPISVTKKCTYSPRFTPLHCAAVNPNVEILIALLRAMPDFNLADADGWTVGHYASVCSSSEPLKYLLQFGISTHAVTSAKRGGDGYSLLHAAVFAGRVRNVKVILDHEAKSSKEIQVPIDDDVDKEDSGKSNKQKTGLLQNDIKYKLTTKGQNALHMACELGHTEIVKLLLKAGMDAERPTPAKFNRVTPLMIAAMYGHLDIVKALVEAGVKVEAKDKRGRTASHHAAMNGHAHVLSYLLRLGVNHLAVDSSGNTLLHYSAAYGWYFATMLLLEAGCPPNAANFWKMTPMAIAFMKGHTGLVTELMKKDGVDVNARIDEDGRTLFLETCKAGHDLDRLKFLVEELNADPTCEDFKGNNALHYMAIKQFREYDSDYKQKLKAMEDCVAYLVQKGCDPLNKNLDQRSPILTAAHSINFHFISKLIDLKISIPFEIDSSQDTVLHFVCGQFIKTDSIVHSVFNNLLEDQGSLSALSEMANTFNKNGYSPLLQLLSTRFSIPNEDFKVKISGVINTFFLKLKADVNAKHNSKNPLTALHFANGSEILEVILKYKPSLDPLDENSQTPLATAVMGSHHEAAEKLIDAGANVNFKIKSEQNIGLALLSAMKEGKSFYLIPKLIAKGADAHEIHPKTKNSILHYIARKPGLPHAIEALTSVLNAGVSPNLTNCDGRTALHLALNARGSETDVFYDIDDVLITAGADLTIKDHRGRIPLHYAFVKIGKPTDTTFFDPIELVSHIVTSMKSSGATSKIHSTDVYGSSALHYSAFRGATICSSFLIQTLKRGEIDLCDNNGNTPFGLAVRNAHEGCALNFYQKDADFLRTINNNITIQDLRTEEATIDGPKQIVAKREPWKWSHVTQEEEERERLREERERYPILEQVVKHDWQGMLYLLVGQLQSTGVGFSTGISTALKTRRFKLALKLSLKVKQRKEMALESGTLFHTLAKYYDGGDEDLIEKICVTFRKNGLDSYAVDEFNSQSVIYALANHQHKLCDVLLPNSKAVLKTLSSFKPDLFGRTPFNVLFWNFEKSPIPHNIALQQFAEQLLSAGANPNQVCEYPFKLSPYPGVRFHKKLTNIIPSDGTRYTPLIAAVIAQSFINVKWLLNIKSSGSLEVNINGQDSEGRTALMHAVRLNDTRMVKLLLDPVNYDYLKDLDGKTLPKLRSSKVDVTLKDKQGYTVMDHLILSPGQNCYYKNVKQIFDMLQSIKAVNTTSGDGSTPLERAVKHKRNDIVEMLSKHVPIMPANKKALLTWNEFSNFPSIFSQDIILSPVTDFTTAAEKMSQAILEKEQEERKRKGEDDSFKTQPDPLCGLEKDNAMLMMDSQQNIPYDCLMTKVDINYGIFGLYNFYKMQLVKQPRGKEMILLFTKWGRVGQTGQYQKTPFSTEEEAIKEFTKIFRAKSGNAWEDVLNFNPIPGKYRVVKKDLRIGKHSTQAKIDFKELEKSGKTVKSNLPRSVLSLMRNLSMIHENLGSIYSSNRYRHGFASRADYGALPFLPLDVLAKGASILNDIGDRIQKKEEFDKDHSGKYTENDKLEVMNDIVKFSEEFYSVIPVFGYSTEKLEPIFIENDLRDKLVDISRLLHLGLAKSLLLAAQFHQATTNSFEYIYRCLGTKIQLLDRSNSLDSEEAELILQYVHNNGDGNVKVSAIYRIDIPSENTRLNATNIQNRQLLWHGTNASNLLSILQNGLQVAPLSAQISGALFGKGVYLADMFGKSQSYCASGNVNGTCNKYMLLCEAALGKIWQVKLQDAGESSSMPAGYDSLKTADSRYEPDPESTVLWKGRTVALGKGKEKYYKEDYGWGLNYNEYIVFNVDQVAVRYLIQFED